MIFDSSAYSWKQLILNTPSDKQQPNYYREVDSLLSVDNLGQIQYCSIIDKNDSSSESKDKIKKILSSSGILDDGNVFDGSSWRLRKYANAMAFYKYNGRNAYIFDWYDKDEPWAIFKRNELLHHDSIIVDKDMYLKTAASIGDGTFVLNITTTTSSGNGTTQFISRMKTAHSSKERAGNEMAKTITS